ncbi:MAG: hypothetical protein KBG58_02170, partial [Giesbergeria sp.]|nr:hypothetical protein [Giesbergeria sp.]
LFSSCSTKMPHSKPAKLYADLGTTEKPLKKQCLVAKCAIVAPRFESAKKNLKKESTFLLSSCAALRSPARCRAEATADNAPLWH